LAGVPAYFGLYAILVPSLVGALFGSSRILSTGPVAMTSLLTAASVIPFAHWGTEQFYTAVVLMAFLSGVVQIAMGLARMGVLLNFLSHPVLMGFINAAAIIIGLSQLAPLVGLSLRNSQHFLVDIAHILGNMDEMHSASLLFGVSSLAVMLALKRFAPRLPGVLIAVTLATVASYLVGFEAMGGRVVGEVPQGLPSFSLPELDWQSSVSLLPMAVVIALVSFMEAMSSCKIIAIRTRTAWDENQELIGQGLAKIAASFNHTMPVSGSFSRSALNLAAGARTGLASIFTAAAVLLTLLVLTPLLHQLPKPTLAAVIILAVISLLNFKVFREAWSASRRDGVAAVTTFAATLLFAPNIQYGILVGMILALVMFLVRTMKPRIVLLGLDENGELQNAERYSLPQFHPKVVAIRFDGQLYFANVNYFESSILYLIGNDADADIRYVLVDARGINGLDASGVAMLRELVVRLRGNGITLVFYNIKLPVLEVMQRTGLQNDIQEKNIFQSERNALKDIKERLDAESGP
ncbi:MAG TPA: SulP family inorganic anion transporter, partial [Gallionella sp.]|nr:SulP family inorganic anion transporter [Gallionella sp.]